MKKLLFVLILGLFLILKDSFVSAQIPIDVNNPYSQNFNSLGLSDTPWGNNATVTGWYYAISINGSDAGPATLLEELSNDDIDVNNFSTWNKPFPFNLGQVLNIDRALGSKAGSVGGNNAEYFFGARFVNSTPNVVTNVKISYVGEQWGRYNGNIRKLFFFYRAGGVDFKGDPNNVGWSAQPTLDFSSPNMGDIGIFNGNLPKNRVAIASDIPIIINPGQEFWIRWVDLYEANGPILGIDDLIAFFSLSGNMTNQPPITNSINLSFSLELKRPKADTTLVFSKSKGFRVKGLIKTTNSVDKVFYSVYGDTNAPTNLNFIAAGKVMNLTRGKFFKSGYKTVFRTKGLGNKPGTDLNSSISQVTLITKIEGRSDTVTGTNLFTNIFKVQVLE